MTRALAVFRVSHRVSHRNISINVRVLPRVADVDSAYRDGKPRRDGDDVVHAFCRVNPGHGARPLIMLPANGRLLELVPHEVVHAVINGGCRFDEEPLADAIGVLSAAIWQELQDRGIGGGP